MRIGILAHVGNGNLGDEATVVALLQSTRGRIPDCQIVVFSMNPADTERRHGVRAVPIRPGASGRPTLGVESTNRPPERLFASPEPRLARLRGWLRRVPLLYAFLQQLARVGRAGRAGGVMVVFLARSFRVLRGLDRLVVAGGGQLGDYFGGPLGYPLTTFRWCALARMAGAKVAFVSTGAEPIRSPVSRHLLRWALAMADYRSFRDEGSRQLLEAAGARTPCTVCPDLVHGLRLGSAAPGPTTGPSLTVGLNPVPYFDHRYWAQHDEVVYERYVAVLAAFACWLLDRNHRVLFFSTQLRADPWVIHDIQLAMKRLGHEGREERILTPPISSFDDLWAALSLTDVIVTSRFHGLIFASLLERPILALSYYRKMEELMASMGQPDYVLPIATLDIESMTRRFEALEHDLAGARARLIERRRVNLSALEAQYDVLLR